MSNHFNSQSMQVFEFLNLNGEPVKALPIAMEDSQMDKIDLCANIIVEELHEVFECYGSAGHVALLKALKKKVAEMDDINHTCLPIRKPEALAKEVADLVYVSLNVAAYNGLAFDMDRVFNAVHNANMSKGYIDYEKACDDTAALNLDMTNGGPEQYCDVHQPVEDVSWWCIKRLSDGKILKGESYEAPVINLQK